MNVLEQIVAHKRIEIEDLKIAEPLDKIVETFDEKEEHLFMTAISNSSRYNIIAEIKKGSPSKGIIKENFNPVSIARNYLNGGACALSVLTESHFFFGQHGYMQVAKNETDLPVLCKDFIIDPFQVYYARYMKADAVLLIVKILTRKQLIYFQEIAKEISLDCLVEVHDENELEIALECDARIIGVNNRNLSDFSISLATAEELSAKIPKTIIKVAESGIFEKKDIIRLAQSGYNAFLIGEALMRSDNPAAHLKELSTK